MSSLSTVVSVIGAGYILAAPGLALSFAFFRRGAIGLLERLALSLALSISVVPLVAFYLYLLGIRLTGLNVVLEVAGIIMAGGGAAWWRHRRAQPAPPRQSPPPQPRSAQAPAASPSAHRSKPAVDPLTRRTKK